jgi:hypothetical protein
MASENLPVKQRCALLILMTEGGRGANPALQARWAFTLTGQDRVRLNEHGLVTSRRTGRSFTHELTDKGWRWCTDELAAEVPPRAGSAAGALYAVLRGLGRYLDATGLALADVFAFASPAERIRDAYAKLAAAPRDWVSLADLRPLLDDLSRDDVDAALVELSRADGVVLSAEPNRKALTADETAAAVRIGGEAKHLLAIEDR